MTYMTIFSTNRKAAFNYDLRNFFEAGIELLGWEVKSIKNNKCNLLGAYGIIRNGEVWLINMDIPPYQPHNIKNEIDTARTRRLLLNKKEIAEIFRKTESEKLSIIPLEIYNKNRHIKIKIGLGLPRRKEDKREAIKKRDISKEIGKRIK